MIRKIKTGVNGELDVNSDGNDQNNRGNLSYSSDSNSSIVESFDLSSFSDNNLSSEANVTEQVALDAISQNLSNNRAMTNNMEQQIYNSFMDKINQYISNGMGK